MTADPVLEIDSVSKSFGPIEVLSDVSVTLFPGDVVAVVGPNGSGKTTLLRTIVGDLNPSTGDVLYTGPSVGRPIGYLPQRSTFRPGFTAGETLSFYASLADGPSPEALLERVGLVDAGSRNVEALSGGMSRLLGIAQAMIGDPPVIVLDEPASGLDPNMSAAVFDTAEEVAEGGKTVVLSSHDLSLVETTADVVVVLSRGSVAAMDAPEELYRRFDVDSLRGVLDSVAEAPGRISVAGGDR